MAKQSKYGITTLRKEFPTNEACLTYIFDTLHSRACSCGGSYHMMKTRKQFQCSKCRFQIAPTAGTIFHKSSTPLTLWFHAIHVFSNAKSGISASQMERDLEVTYKTAWRILSQIRKALIQSTRKLRGEVEIDTGFFGGRAYGGKNNKNLSEAILKKSIVTVAVERGGRIKAEVSPTASSSIMQDFIERNIEPVGTKLMTDKSRVYIRSDKTYDRDSVNHKQKEYARKNVHINTIEAFFSHVKRSIGGTHKIISKQHLQSYLDGFVFHYNNRHSDRQRFSSLLGTLVSA